MSGIPKLAIFGEDGALLTEEGRELVLADPMGDTFPWADGVPTVVPAASTTA